MNKIKITNISKRIEKCIKQDEFLLCNSVNDIERQKALFYEEFAEDERKDAILLILCYKLSHTLWSSVSSNFLQLLINDILNGEM